MPTKKPHMGRMKARQVVRIHAVTPRDTMSEEIHSAIREITEAFQEQSVAPHDDWFALDPCRPTKTFDFDVCFPVLHEVTTSGRLECTSMPEVAMVRNASNGYCEGLPRAWHEFHHWVERHGRKLTEQAIEQYGVGARQQADPQAWQIDRMLVLAQGQVSKERYV